MMKPKIKGLIYEEHIKAFKIRELEVSITSKCHLSCDNCGFYIPNQPEPSISKDVNIIRLKNATMKVER